MTKLENIFLVASKNNDLTTIKECIKQKVDIDIKDYHGNTALTLSSKYGYLEIVKCLIEQGADINAKNNNGSTALINSVANNFFEIAKYLINNKANVNIKNNFNSTALTYALATKELKLINYLIPYIYEYNQFENIYNNLKIEQKHILFKHFMNNRELLEQVNPRIMKGFIPDINKYKNNLKQGI